MALRQHLLRISLLLALATLVQSWVVAHAVVPAQDAVRYLAGAQAMARDGWWPALLAASDPPLHPTVVAGMHSALQFGIGENDASRLLWLQSLQASAAAAVVLSVVPLYVLLLRWIGTLEAFCGGVLFCVLTSVARLGGDGLSDGLQLLACLSALCGLTIFLTSAPQPGTATRWLAIVLAGLALGWGILAGSAAMALFVAAMMALAFDALRNRATSSLLGAAAAPVALAGGVLVVLGPYLLATAGFDPELLASRIRADHRPENAAYLNALAQPMVQPSTVDVAPSQWRLASGEPMAFGHKETSSSLRARGVAAALKQFGVELFRLLGPVVAILAVAGAGYSAAALEPRRVDRVLLGLSAGYALLAIAHAARSGYLADRHLLPLLPLALAVAARAICAGGAALARQMPWAESWADVWPRVPAAGWISRAMLVLTAAFCLLPTSRPLHASRWGHRQAAEWLAARTAPGNVVLDTRGWTCFYSGRATYRHEAAAAALANPRLAFVVVEERELATESPRSRTLREILSRSAQPVVRFSNPGTSADAGVAVYRWHPERFAALVEAPGASRQ
ncbi:MAG: hypothetical protein JNG90_05460 [Planctomycetaceae bacterium]|nr:hypothetical protein [Planctomycetaceae bacterium]